MQKQYVSLTLKAMRVQQLRAEGHSFDEAFEIADSEYTINGMEQNHYVSVITQHEQAEEVQL